MFVFFTGVEVEGGERSEGWCSRGSVEGFESKKEFLRFFGDVRFIEGLILF